MDLTRRPICMLDYTEPLLHRKHQIVVSKILISKTMLKPTKDRFDIQITQANKTVSKSFELDKNIKCIKGVLVTSNRDELMYHRGTQKIEINKEEYFPENYESKLLMSGVNVAPNHRYYHLGNVNPGNGIINLVYTDSDDGLTTFAPYRVSLYVDTEREDMLS